MDSRVLCLYETGHHDTNYAVIGPDECVHVELERHSRVKMDKGDAVELYNSTYTGGSLPKHVVGIVRPPSIGEIKHVVWHHQAHAAHAYFSSPFDKALIFAIDGRGREDIQIARFTVWVGEGHRLYRIAFAGYGVGHHWAASTRLMGYSVRGPLGDQCGTVMAMAAFGNPERWGKAIYDLIIEPGKHQKAIRNLYGRFVQSDQDKFDWAAGLQVSTNKLVRRVLKNYLTDLRDSNYQPFTNVCFSGGCALNSVLMGRLVKRYPKLNFYVPPAPADGGLALGGAQYVYHSVLQNPRIRATPYLGKSYGEQDIKLAIRNMKK